ncbi:uncharacterized protein LOC105427777 [Pogonomyrmex barbatus]|uniref:Uncharacterized protein LOC105427777 n=1 Tax=Pogonomyrmex barbatus TaxID=144034 RepID=A0A6I9W7C3_9HYME|nr:uncharacterized protein LOC105427777 [Pogonomyrmex barbatus]
MLGALPDISPHGVGKFVVRAIYFAIAMSLIPLALIIVTLPYFTQYLRLRTGADAVDDSSMEVHPWKSADMRRSTLGKSGLVIGFPMCNKLITEDYTVPNSPLGRTG